MKPTGMDEIVEKEIQDITSGFGYTRKQAIEYLVTNIKVQGCREGITESQKKEILEKLEKENRNGRL